MPKRSALAFAADFKKFADSARKIFEQWLKVLEY
jgi:hypothetical protein